jgi:large subunit ribosomal protein L15
MINTLPSIKNKSKKRVGRGMGSGKGSHTVGRGQKGQKSRRTIHPLFEGTKMKKSLIQRLPLQRGKGKLKPTKKTVIIINVGELELLPDNSKVDMALLIKTGMVAASKRSNVKILGSGDLTKKLNVELPVSQAAAAKIQKAGGTVISA